VNNPTKTLRHLISQFQDHFQAFDTVITWGRFVDGDFDEQALQGLRTVIPLLVADYEELGRLLRYRVRTSGRLTGLRPHELEYYAEVVEPRANILNRLRLWSLFNDVDADGQWLTRELMKTGEQDSLAHYEMITRAIDIALNRVEENEEYFRDYEWFDEIDVEGARELVDSEIFRPDQWHENAKRIRPVLLGKHPAIKNSLRLRLDDLYKSYILGQYLSGIAMARSVLAYALATWAKNHRFNNPQDLKLEDLIDLVTERVSVLSKDRLNIVRLNGNAIMHPEVTAHDNVVEFPPSEGTCQRCIKIVIETIEALHKDLA